MSFARSLSVFYVILMQTFSMLDLLLRCPRRGSGRHRDRKSDGGGPSSSSSFRDNKIVVEEVAVSQQ